MTSIWTAIRIVESSSIWGQDIDDFANFSLNQVPLDRLDERCDVSLSFEFSGPIELVPFDGPSSVKPDVLYIYVTEWAWTATLTDTKFWAARLAPGSSRYLKCVRAAFTEDFEVLCARELKSALLKKRLIQAIAKSPAVAVPQTEVERLGICRRHPIPKPTALQIIKAWSAKCLGVGPK